MAGIATRLIGFLKALEEAFPPPRGVGHHALTYNRYGSDENGWRDVLGLHVRTSGPASNEISWTFFVDDQDFDKTDAELIAEIRTEFAEAV